MIGIEGWQTFSDSRFSLCCRYPAVTPSGKAVEVRAREQPGILRAHLISPDSPEVYFEITRFSGLIAEGIYLRHRMELEQRFADLAITPLEPAVLASRPAQRYSFAWEQGRRAAFLIVAGEEVYRVLYNPVSPLNEQILATIEWVS